VTECRALLTFARVALRGNVAADHARAEEALARALALVAETGAGLYEPLIHRELSEIARRRGASLTRRTPAR
jgi:hypothetical protein